MAHGPKRKMMFDLTDVMSCEHSETLAPSGHDQELQEVKSNKLLKVLGIAGNQNLATCHAYHVI